MRDYAATPAQKDPLVGQVYSGVVSVQAVRISPTDRAIVHVDALPSDHAEHPRGPVVRLRFAVTTDDEKVQQLRRGEDVRVRGTLKDFSGAVANFTDLVIEGPAR